MHMAGGGCTGGGGGMHVHPVHPPWVRPCRRVPYILPYRYLLVSVINTGTVTPNALNRYRYV
jgi:hypothetical protein